MCVDMIQNKKKRRKKLGEFSTDEVFIRPTARKITKKCGASER